MWEPQSCRVYRLALGWFQMGMALMPSNTVRGGELVERAIGLYCSIPDVRESAKAVGLPCPQDAPQVQSVSTVPTAPVTMPIPVAAVPVPLPNRPFFCSVPGLNIASYPECR